MHPDSPATWYNCSQQGAKGSLRRKQETEGKKAKLRLRPGELTWKRRILREKNPQGEGEGRQNHGHHEDKVSLGPPPMGFYQTHTVMITETLSYIKSLRELFTLTSVLGMVCKHLLGQDTG